MCGVEVGRAWHVCGRVWMLKGCGMGVGGRGVEVGWVSSGVEWRGYGIGVAWRWEGPSVDVEGGVVRIRKGVWCGDSKGYGVDVGGA